MSVIYKLQEKDRFGKWVTKAEFVEEWRGVNCMKLLKASRSGGCFQIVRAEYSDLDDEIRRNARHFKVFKLCMKIIGFVALCLLCVSLYYQIWAIWHTTGAP